MSEMETLVGAIRDTAQRMGLQNWEQIGSGAGALGAVAMMEAAYDSAVSVSQGRRKVLFEKAEELRVALQRAEAAEVERDAIKRTLEWVQAEKHGAQAAEEHVRNEAYALRQRAEIAEAALATLVRKLDVIHADKRYRGVWECAQLHWGPYEGPQYAVELHNARVVVESLAQPKPKDGEEPLMRDAGEVVGE